MSETPPLKITYLTSGAAGMFCGSCMHDNTLARALIKLGCDVQLVPLYTPIRTDEESIASDRVFLGGMNVYLQQKFSLFRYLPRWIDGLLDYPWLIRFATSFGIRTTAKDLGALAVSVLKGDAGFQRKEVERLVQWLAGDKPDVIVFSNMLTAGCVPAIKRRLGARVVVTLQGDDIFLRDLPEPYKAQAFAEIRRLLPEIDGFIANSNYYADFMSEYLGIPREKFHVVPLGVDTRDFVDSHLSLRESTPFRGAKGDDGPPTIGYLARLAPRRGCTCWSTPSSISTKRWAMTTRGYASRAGWGITIANTSRNNFKNSATPAWRTSSTTWAKWIARAKSSSSPPSTCSRSPPPIASPRGCSSSKRWRRGCPLCNLVMEHFPN